MMKKMFVILLVLLALSTVSATGTVSQSRYTGVLGGLKATQPQILSAPTTAFRGENIKIEGSGFGVKGNATPFRTSYLNPHAGMNFQESGMFNSSYWFLTGAVMVALQKNFSRIPGDYYVRLEYSRKANNLSGYSAGLNTELPFNKTQRVQYMAWWDYFSEDFNFSNMQTGAASMKYIYLNAGGHPHEAVQIMQDGRILASASGGVGGNTSEEQQENLTLPYGGGFYGRPISWVSDYNFPKGQWYFIELLYKINTAPGVHDGWVEMRVDNRLVYRAEHIDIYDPNETNSIAYMYLRIGGNYGFNDSSDAVYYRYFGDVYVDDSFARVYIGDRENFSDCTHLELQVPTSWSENSININFNSGSFANGTKVYLFVVNPDGNVSNGYPIVISGGTVPEFSPIYLFTLLAAPAILIILRKSGTRE